MMGPEGFSVACEIHVNARGQLRLGGQMCNSCETWRCICATRCKDETWQETKGGSDSVCARASCG